MRPGRTFAGGALRLLLALWAGSLWAQIWAASTAFAMLTDRHMAGALAARLFAIESYLGLGVAAFALSVGFGSRFKWGFLGAALLCLNEWAIKRVMNAALERGSVLGLSFGPWHGVSAIIYLLACAAVLWLVWKEDFR